MWRGVCLTEISELTAYFSGTLIQIVQQEVLTNRQYVAGKVSTHRIQEPAPGLYRSTEFDGDQHALGTRMRTLIAETYNVQHLGDYDSEARIVSKLNAHVLGLTGTRRLLPADPKAETVIRRSLPQHDVYHFLAPRNTTAHTNSHSGVSIALKKKFFHQHRVAEIYEPPKELRGRGGALRIKRYKDTDLLVLVVYFSQSKDGNVSYDPSVEKLLKWMDAVLDSLPERCFPLVLTDANGQIGPPPGQ